MAECRSFIAARHPGAVVFFNGTTSPHDTARLHEFNTQNDLEDLPTLEEFAQMAGDQS